MSETNDTGGKVTVADLRKMVADLVGEAVKVVKPESDTGSKDTGRQPDSRSVAEQVQAALAGIRDKDEREKRDRTIDQTLAELQERTKEKPPVERRRVHKIMGWGE